MTRPAASTRSATFGRAWAIAVLLACAVLFGAPAGQAWADPCPAGGKHDYEAELITPCTDEEDGLQRFTCLKCGDSFEQVIPATGHAWGPWETIVPATCEHEGFERRVCANDDGHFEEREVAPLSKDGSHAWVEDDRLPATCETTGWVYYICARCDADHYEELAALGHAWGPWETVREAEVGREGLERRVCSHDATHVEERAIAALPEEPSSSSSAAEHVVSQAAPAPAEPVSGESAPAEPVAAQAEEAEDSGAGDWTPNALDAVLVGADVGAVAVFFLFVWPLVFARRWVSAKRQLARKRLLGKQP